MTEAASKSKKKIKGRLAAARTAGALTVEKAVKPTPVLRRLTAALARIRAGWCRHSLSKVVP